MALDILAIFTEATAETQAFANHPMAKAGLEEQVLYLQGLALVMSVDSVIDIREQGYFEIFLTSFGLDTGMLDNLVDFANAPDKGGIQSFVKCFRRRTVAQLFLFDALMMTRRDGQLHEKETALVNAMADQLEILKGTQRDIFDLFCLIKNKNWIECSLYFDSYLLSSEHFQHLLDYHGVDLNDLLKQAKVIGKLRLRENLASKLGLTIRVKAKSWSWIFTPVESKELNLSGGIDGLASYTCLLSSDIMIPFLQNLVDRREIRIVGDDHIVKIKGKPKSKVKNEIELCQLSKLGLGYDKEYESLIVISNSKVSYSATDMPLELLNELIERVQ